MINLLHFAVWNNLLKLNSGIDKHTMKIHCLFIIICTLFATIQAQSERLDSISIADFNRANTYYAQGDYKKAIILYRKSLKKGINPGVIAFNIGNCYFQEGDLPSAAASYRRAIRAGTDGVDMGIVQFNLAGVLYRLGNYGESIAAYRRGLQIDNSNISAWLYLAEAYQKTGDLIGAQKALEEAMYSEPDDASIIYQLGEVHVSLKEIDRAIELVNQAYLIIPDETDFLFYLSELHMLNNDTLNAINSYREALGVEPDNVNGHYRLADILDNTNQKFLAMEHLTKALAIKPDYTDAAIFLGNIAFDLQWWDRSFNAYKQALDYGDTEGILGIINLVNEYLNRKDLVKAQEIGKSLVSITINDTSLRQEWESVKKMLW